MSAVLRSVAPLSEASFVSLAALGPSGTALSSMFSSCKQVTVITGAGISTSSGIPDYRSPGRPDYKPLQHHQYMTNEAVRTRYWARSYMGFSKMDVVEPNAGHRALAALEGQHNKIRTVITQNVDRLHHKAGSKNIVELHGTIHLVECLSCKAQMPRMQVQEQMRKCNAMWLSHFAENTSERPDGDVELPAISYQSFTVPKCECCNSANLKPMVVFFGGSVPPHVSEAASNAIDESDGLLVVGSTLSTWSALRLVRRFVARAAAQSSAAMPFGIINFGDTRADEMALFKIQAHTSSVLSALEASLRPLR
jgi:NAD-dependent deacetylase sirtuin 4